MKITSSKLASLVIAVTAVVGTVTFVAISHASTGEVKTQPQEVVQPKISPNSDSENIRVIPPAVAPTPSSDPSPTATTSPTVPTMPPSFTGGGDDSNDDSGDTNSDDGHEGEHHHDDGEGEDD